MYVQFNRPLRFTIYAVNEHKQIDDINLDVLTIYCDTEEGRIEALPSRVETQ